VELKKRFLVSLQVLVVRLKQAGILSDADAKRHWQLLKDKGCTACHANDKKVIGPAYKEVAKKYKGDAGAAKKLEAKVKAGGGGVWGTIPMPPNNVPDADINTIVEWVLSMQ